MTSPRQFVLVGALALLSAVAPVSLVAASTAERSVGEGMSKTVAAASGSDDLATMNLEAGSRLGPSGILPASHAWPRGSSSVTAAWDTAIFPERDRALRLTLDSDESVAELTIVPPPGEQLTERRYDNVRALTSYADGTARLGLVVEGRSCPDELYGTVDVRRLSNDLSDVWVVYDLHCSGREGSAFGEVRIGAPAPGPGPDVTATDIVWPATQPGREGHVVPLVVNTSVTDQTVTARVTGSNAFRIVRSTCEPPQDGVRRCRVLVGFRPTVSGAVSGQVEVGDRTGVTVVPLSGQGRPGATRWKTVSPTTTHVYRSDRHDLVVDGDRDRVTFYADDGEPETGSSYGSLTVRGGGIAAGRTYRIERGADNDAFLSVSGVAGGGSFDYDTADLRIDRADVGAEGGLRALSFTYTLSRRGTPALTSTLDWQVDELTEPTRPEPQPVSGPLPVFNPVVTPHVGSVDVSWATTVNGAAGARVGVRALGSSRPFHTVYEGPAPRIPVRGLQAGVDLELRLQLLDALDRVVSVETFELRGTRIELDAERPRGKPRAKRWTVTGTLLSSQDQALSRDGITLIIRRPNGRTTTERHTAGPAGFTARRRLPAGTEVTAVWSGLVDRTFGTYIGSTAHLLVPRR